MRRTFEVEVREDRLGRKWLFGVMVQEGWAALGGRTEVFAPGSVRWPAHWRGCCSQEKLDPGVSLSLAELRASDLGVCPVEKMGGQKFHPDAETLTMEATIDHR